MEPLRNPKLAEVIASHIEHMILEGVLRPGERLASERDLAARLEVSRPPLREALERLVHRGLLRTTPSGTHVAHFLTPLTSPLASLLQGNPQVVDDYFEYRGLVEGPTARLAALRATEVDRQAIRACLDRLEVAHGVEDPSQETDLDADLHMLLYEATHNLVVLQVMRAFSELLRSDVFYSRHKLYLSPGTRETLLAQHMAIGEAVIAGEADKAEAQATTHIRFTAEALQRLREEEIRIGQSLRRVGRTEMLG